MKALGFHQIKAPLDSLDAQIEAIHAPIELRHVFLEACHPHFNELDVVLNPVEPLFHSRQARLDLLQHWDDDIGDLAHFQSIPVPTLFYKRARPSSVRGVSVPSERAP